ncbi:MULTISPECIES: pyrimidine-nucleoside phosphorylase [Clostridium]|jgi:pyrimidine-nucleoside phosphorylase|uniref:pyrimidine-nucleoside phosphorylase n=1 Tax=Clostridium TaxID=1485 RepID=UPI000C088DF0|nr:MULTISPECIES: pyrimidine-nucleoside phosphorylase [Clostridium]MBS5308323.1 pyrimidine-nucleoside phosphorylase [Clostridium sp.]MDB1933220.1 pyrimidine-nucleoside phosphorylase [Clostridium tertium]MDB1938092.1 pyrimidine-nucleoside phosphorylase [Clostridium tertium]MDB1941686.1 pyrimidine-nucleoside phosphorylase [Clostridium tertium]MDB1944022.1 pyrimidine-nucleoside phosphorylase [Clostridium tertium]
MRMYDIILKKRKGLELSTEEIEFFVNGFTKGEVPDYQASALLMAIFFNKMNKRETADLTMAMVNSGDKIDLSSINGVKVDKHSTGGVGDKTSICLTPLVASLGVPVAKMSGRGLGHTGGTIDKLEAFNGFSVELSEETFINNSNAIGIALTGQTGNIAPADKKIYALRDVTATVDNMSLIASSIMSKKIASGADAIVLDVKVGDGAFMKTPEDAKALAREMVDIGSSVGRKTIGVISDMDQPLGYAIGNSLEVKEAIELLKGNGPKDLLELTLTLGSYMLVCGKTARNFEEGKALLLENINNGKGLEKLKEFVKAQGGDASLIDDTDKFPKAKYVVEVKAAQSGVISKINAEAFGLIAMELGAGRETKESIIDLSVGIVLNKKRGEVVKEGDILAYIHSNDESNIEKAKNDIIKNMIISNSLDKEIPLIYDIVE